MGNMTIWDAVKQPPPYALKQIGGGRLKGMTDVNPQWRYQVMTEQFGICGIGWKYIVKRVWNETIPDGQVFAFAEIDLCIKAGDIWRDPIPGIGGSMLVSKEATGLHPTDEGYKMAITDALSVAMKMLGVGADVYAGRWDGSKYKDDAGAVTDHSKGQASPKPQPKPEAKKPETTAAQPKKEHWCKKHNMEFFMRGKMKSYAHPPLPDEKDWCYEHKDEPKAETPKLSGGNMPEDWTNPPTKEELQAALEAEEAVLKYPRDPATVTTIKLLCDACWKDFGMMPAAVAAECGVKTVGEISGGTVEAYIRIATPRLKGK